MPTNDVVKTIEQGWNYRTDRKRPPPPLKTQITTGFTGTLTRHSVAFLSRQDKTTGGRRLLYGPLDWLPDGGGFAQGKTVGV